MLETPTSSSGGAFICNGDLLRELKEKNDCCDFVNDNDKIVAISLKPLQKAKIKEITKDCTLI